jgi:hypothetical protein
MARKRRATMTIKSLLSRLTSISRAIGQAFGARALTEMLTANLTNVDSLMSGFSPR